MKRFFILYGKSHHNIISPVYGFSVLQDYQFSQHYAVRAEPNSTEKCTILPIQYIHSKCSGKVLALVLGIWIQKRGLFEIPSARDWQDHKKLFKHLRTTPERSIDRKSTHVLYTESMNFSVHWNPKCTLRITSWNWTVYVFIYFE